MVVSLAVGYLTKLTAQIMYICLPDNFIKSLVWNLTAY